MSAATAARPQDAQNSKNSSSDITQRPAQKESRVTMQALAEVNRLLQQGKLILPADYHAANALNSAWLTLQTIQNRDRKPIINALGQVDTSVVTVTSVANALRDMVIWGLNPAKKQVYFILYGNELVCQRSYFGDLLLAKRARPNTEFFYDTIRESEDFVTNKEWNKLSGLVDKIAQHSRPFPRKENIVGAYCGAFDTTTGDMLGLTLFDMARIRKSWAKSKSPAVQNEYPEEMALRTVIRHRAKIVINTSSDALLLEAVHRHDEEMVIAEVAEDAAENANGATLSLPSPPVAHVAETVDIDTGEVLNTVDMDEEEAPF